MKILDRSRRRIYRGKIKKLIDVLGLESVAQRAYYFLFGLFSRDRREVNIENDSFEIITDNPKVSAGREYILDEEKDVFEDFFEELNSGDVVYDAGANFGLYSCMADLVPDVIVYAFEPVPDNFERLEKNLEHNSVKGGSFNVALSDYNGSEFMSFTKNAGVGNVSLNGNEGDVEVQVRKLDNFIENRSLEKPNIMKIDVEGAEKLLLDGAKEILRSEDLRLIYIEVHPEKIKKFDCSIEEISEILSDFGFETRRMSMRDNVNEEGEDFFLKASRSN